ncbi:MAG: Sporulation related protein [Nitrobacter sp.]|uniref:SPOR domain-containing protein n=1 Tax=Nitrobacter sp. TaxID=29420 RepID=UPI00387DF35B
MAHRYQDRSFRDDGEYGRDDYGRDERRASGPAETDPLAELARLIGQTDPFADVKRSAPPPAPADDPVDHFEHRFDPVEDDAEPSGQRPAVMDSKTDGSARSAAGRLRRRRSAVLRRAAVYPDNEPHVQHHEPESYHEAADRYDDVLFGRLPDGRDAHAYEDQFPPERYPEAPFDYQGYGEVEDEPAPRRRGGMATVVAVLALAVIGTGAAYAYRNYAGTARSGAPPVIKADAEPNKILPQRVGSGDAVGKLIQDRMSTEDGTEQMVSREEQPVDVKDATTSGPRVVFPPLNQNTNPPPAASVTPNVRPPATVANGTVAGDEPRRVRTLTVRGDQSDLAAAAVARPETPAAPVAPPARHAPPATTAPAGNVPLALSPQAEPRMQVASTNPGQHAPAVAGTGGYLVQISSQRNEADAQASFRALQHKFPSVLGSRSALVKRADLGAKGVYYRAMVGPFGSSEEASRFCGSLKSAGGQCVIQRN